MASVRLFHMNGSDVDRPPPPPSIGFYMLSTQEEKSISGAHAAVQGQMVESVMITESPR